MANPTESTSSNGADIRKADVGVLIESDSAPYDFKKGNDKSPYVKIRDEEGNERVHWGVLLPNALAQAGAEIGDLIHLEQSKPESVEIGALRHVGIDLETKWHDAAGKALGSKSLSAALKAAEKSGMTELGGRDSAGDQLATYKFADGVWQRDGAVLSNDDLQQLVSRDRKSATRYTWSVEVLQKDARSIEFANQTPEAESEPVRKTRSQNAPALKDEDLRPVPMLGVDAHTIVVHGKDNGETWLLNVTVQRGRKTLAQFNEMPIEQAGQILGDTVGQHIRDLAEVAADNGSLTFQDRTRLADLDFVTSAVLEEKHAESPEKHLARRAIEHDRAERERKSADFVKTLHDRKELVAQLVRDMPARTSYQNTELLISQDSNADFSNLKPNEIAVQSHEDGWRVNWAANGEVLQSAFPKQSLDDALMVALYQVKDANESYQKRDDRDREIASGAAKTFREVVLDNLYPDNPPTRDEAKYALERVLPEFNKLQGSEYLAAALLLADATEEFPIYQSTLYEQAPNLADEISGIRQALNPKSITAKENHIEIDGSGQQFSQLEIYLETQVEVSTSELLYAVRATNSDQEVYSKNRITYEHLESLIGKAAAEHVAQRLDGQSEHEQIKSLVLTAENLGELQHASPAKEQPSMTIPGLGERLHLVEIMRTVEPNTGEAMYSAVGSRDGISVAGISGLDGAGLETYFGKAVADSVQEYLNRNAGRGRPDSLILSPDELSAMVRAEDGIKITKGQEANVLEEGEGVIGASAKKILRQMRNMLYSPKDGSVAEKAEAEAPEPDNSLIPPSVEANYTQRGKILFHIDDQRERIVDSGDKLLTTSDESRAAKAMAEIAIARGWESIELKGTKQFRRDAWLETATYGIEVKGYTPTEKDLAALKVRQRALGNQIHQVEPSKAAAVDTQKVAPAYRANTKPRGSAGKDELDEEQQDQNDVDARAQESSAKEAAAEPVRIAEIQSPKAKAFLEMRREDALKQYPELKDAYAAMYLLKAQGNQVFADPDARKMFDNANRQAIAQYIESGKALPKQLVIARERPQERTQITDKDHLRERTSSRKASGDRER